MYVLSFHSTDANLQAAGGKGMNLGILARAGFPVPPGFIISTVAYRDFSAEDHLGNDILRLIHDLRSEDIQDIEAASREIQGRFDRAVIPNAIADEIHDAYRTLGSGTGAASSLAVAVRSSATAEDLPGITFAGQQDTYLNVIGETAVIQAVQQCWASLWTARAIAYRAHNGISPEEIALAVVVQQMVNSEASGILFTANPMNGRRDEMVIDASFGLGEAVVSGVVDPDHYLVDPQTWRIKERKLGAKAVSILPRLEGGTVKASRPAADEQALPDAQIIDLARIAQQVAKHFGIPQDIEWALADGQMYLLQARPITSLYPLPQNPYPEQGLRYYVNFNAIQGVTDPLTPMGIDALRLLFGGVTQMLGLHSSMQDLLPEAGQRLFMDYTDLVRDPRLRPAGLGLVADTDPAAQKILLHLFETRPIEPKRVLTLQRGIRLVWGVLPVLLRAVSAMLAPDRVYPQSLATAEPLMVEMWAHVQERKSLLDILRAMEVDLPRTESISFRIMPSVLPVFSLIPLVDRWLANWLGEPPGTARRLLQGLANNLTVEMNLRLWNAAQVIREDPQACALFRSQSAEILRQAFQENHLPESAQKAIQDFLQAYGMRGVAEIDLGRPKWQEDPTPILKTLLGYLQIKDANLAPDILYHRGAEEAERLTQDILARVRKTRFGWLRAKLLEAVIHRIRTLGGLREVPLFYLVRSNGIFRAALLQRGQDLAASGELENAEDIFFVPMDVLKQFAEAQSGVLFMSGSGAAGPIVKPDLKIISQENRERYSREQLRKRMPHVLISNGEALFDPPEAETENTGDLVGEAVSPGVVEGRVHVILDPGKEHLEPGEILVCPSTDPGWTPLFLTAGGLVMEIGGLITHGAIVAREYGLPAVVGIHEATTRLKTGQRVRVDGNSGRVLQLDR